MVSKRYFLQVGIFTIGLLAGALAMYGFQPRQASNTPQAASHNLQPNTVDIGFSQSMIIHHDQAISMASLVKGKVAPNIDLLAHGILTAQLQEVGQMKGWLTAWGQKVTPQAKAPMAWVENARNVTNVQDLLYITQCKAEKGAMAGMLNVDEFNHMRGLSGIDLERQFLESMIKHHEAAIPMARFVVNNGRSLLVKGLAKAMIREQNAEISMMRKLLSQLNA
ncbi:MAG: DUF305 domain-containing protein [Limnobacter sp.]|uniref:DUF305 domain-containing protein n=1 Tax=Limnobacter sp. TaxID=2003368 RepID=UPI0032EB2867